MGNEIVNLRGIAPRLFESDVSTPLKADSSLVPDEGAYNSTTNVVAPQEPRMRGTIQEEVLTDQFPIHLRLVGKSRVHTLVLISSSLR